MDEPLPDQHIGVILKYVSKNTVVLDLLEIVYMYFFICLLHAYLFTMSPMLYPPTMTRTMTKTVMITRTLFQKLQNPHESAVA